MNQKAPSFGSRSNVGCVRQQNEDSLIALPPLYAVADGMGGHAAGEVASELAVDILSEHASSIHDSEALITVVRTINRSIIEAAEGGLGRLGMGTTLTAVIVDGSRLLIAQVGDSRAYLLHNGTLQKLTRDHSYVGELLAGGHISATEAASHPKRSVITRALGSDPKTEADIYELEAAVEDRLLICTDGLYGMVSEDAIAALLAQVSDPQCACDDLVSAALEGGGLDNISAIVVDITSSTSEFLTFSTEEQKATRNSATKRHRGRASRERRPRKLHLGILAFLILLVVLVGSAIGGTWWYASNSAFLRAEDGKVAVYRGLPGEVLPGLHLEWLAYTTDIETSELLSLTADRLEEGVAVDSLDDAADLIDTYEQQIQESSARQNGNSS